MARGWPHLARYMAAWLLIAGSCVKEPTLLSRMELDPSHLQCWPRVHKVVHGGCGREGCPLAPAGRTGYSRPGHGGWPCVGEHGRSLFMPTGRTGYSLKVLTGCAGNRCRLPAHAHNQ
ncbi:hypothetical protein Dimus_025041, partial [Dionaea muscipula]